ncbi:hypothetical protein SAMN05216271_0743 [Halopseudomonas sabulinigri]|uniref:Uncharacterized protein n=1 Tax=Halopseudomonas sabulinigri TaxID=472181 RepID=A0A1H1N0X3_9GAMM|nr:hypothetical protein SAMN05216271_0743 [Halopseudomonas sabulinigri]
MRHFKFFFQMWMAVTIALAIVFVVTDGGSVVSVKILLRICMLSAVFGFAPALFGFAVSRVFFGGADTRSGLVLLSDAPKLAYSMLVVFTWMSLVFLFVATVYAVSYISAEPIAEYLFLSGDVFSDVGFFVALLLFVVLHFLVFPRIFPFKCPRCYRRSILVGLWLYRVSFECKKCGWSSDRPRY